MIFKGLCIIDGNNDRTLYPFALKVGSGVVDTVGAEVVDTVGAEVVDTVGSEVVDTVGSEVVAIHPTNTIIKKDIITIIIVIALFMIP